MLIGRQYSILDELCMGFDQMLRTLNHIAPKTNAPNPSDGISEPELTPPERRHAAGLMRVNHAGEIAAQALYHGQALMTRSLQLRAHFQQAAVEEGNHLAWCESRLSELASHTSYLSPLWYVGSFCIGMAAGFQGDAWSLGFVAETEKQVGAHLASHLEMLPIHDVKSRRIVAQMAEDEALHRDVALQEGGKPLPSIVQKAMGWTAKFMVKMAYYV